MRFRPNFNLQQTLVSGKAVRPVKSGMPGKFPE